MGVKEAIEWRKRHYKNQSDKALHYLKNLFDTAGKETVESVSVIVVGRNDNYGGDFSQRLRSSLDWNLKHLPSPELIYIEWNAIPDRPSDCKWISERYPDSKCFIVPNEIHTSIAHDPEKMKVMEYFGKNLGIRQATKDWILMVNADVFIGRDVIKNISNLSPDAVYGTHYVSIRWDEKPISDYHQKNKKNIVTAFAAPKYLDSVVGNFILTHRKNWLKATGYDERLNNVRAGVDSNGLRQLLHLGLKTRVLGHHYHLDHPESIIHGKNDTHGKNQFNNVPYKNPDNWGCVNYPLKKISDRIWELQKI